MTILINAEESFDKFQQPMKTETTTTATKTLHKMAKGEIFLNITKVIYDKPTINVILNGEKLEPFPLRSGTKPEYSLSPFSFNIVLEVLLMKIREAKKKKKKEFKLEKK